MNDQPVTITCSCGQQVEHAQTCTAVPKLWPPSTQPVDEVAHTIATGGAFSDQDAVRVARAYLEALNQ